MLIIKVRPDETVDQAIKRYKRKHRDVKTMQQLRKRKHFTKPSEERREEMIKAKFKQSKSNAAG
ncbi:MAG TPA: 30S ribosomal protein S21 [Bacteroidetes bacterium]|jgi:small subunit ribosomal protein S21|nr:30S ribosomal protein S21 [Bacteroidota bacterium]|tara:strand:+ start:1235 stop:1426 length:192 start_codon:yes stop_codon:yes gene_type:complete